MHEKTGCCLLGDFLSRLWDLNWKRVDRAGLFFSSVGYFFKWCVLLLVSQHYKPEL